MRSVSICWYKHEHIYILGHTISVYLCNTLPSLRCHPHWQADICIPNNVHNSLPFSGWISTVERVTEFNNFSILLLQLPLVFHVVLDQLWESCKLLASVQVIEVTSVLNFDVSNFTIPSEMIQWQETECCQIEQCYQIKQDNNALAVWATVSDTNMLCSSCTLYCTELHAGIIPTGHKLLISFQTQNYSHKQSDTPGWLVGTASTLNI